MSLRLDAVQTHGGWRFAVLCEAVVRARHLGGGIFGTGSKWPVAVVFHDGETLTAMDFRGRALDVETLEVDEGASGAMVGFNVHFHALASASITVKYA